MFLGTDLPALALPGPWKTYTMLGFVAWHVGTEVLLEVHSYRLSRKGTRRRAPNTPNPLPPRVLNTCIVRGLICLALPGKEIMFKCPSWCVRAFLLGTFGMSWEPEMGERSLKTLPIRLHCVSVRLHAHGPYQHMFLLLAVEILDDTRIQIMQPFTMAEAEEVSPSCLY